MFTNSTCTGYCRRLIVLYHWWRHKVIWQNIRNINKIGHWCSIYSDAKPPDGSMPVIIRPLRRAVLNLLHGLRLVIIRTLRRARLNLLHDPRPVTIWTLRRAILNLCHLRRTICLQSRNCEEGLHWTRRSLSKIIYNCREIPLQFIKVDLINWQKIYHTAT